MKRSRKHNDTKPHAARSKRGGSAGTPPVPPADGPAVDDGPGRMTPVALPAAFVARTRQELGDPEALALCEALEGTPPVCIRLNPAKWPRTAASTPEAEMSGRTAASEADRPDTVHAALSGSRGATPSSCGPASAEPDATSRPAGERDTAEQGAAGRPETGQNATEQNSSGRPETEQNATEQNSSGRPETEQNATEQNSSGRPETEQNATEQNSSGRPAEVRRVAGEPVAGRIPWSAEGLYLAERPSFTCDPAFHAGAYYVQEASSQFVGHLLRGAGALGARILDLCAAPGGKTTLYASLVGPDGLVVANEIDRRRARVLADNVRKWGTGNTVVTSNEPAQLARFENRFDIVAVDAPCSGEGMFRKDPQARAEWSEGSVRLCAARQAEILRAAWAALRPGGTLVYSTCTFNRTEDEGVLEELLGWAADEVVESEPIPTDPSWGIVCGRVGAFRTFRFYPHRTQGEGFFAATARKAPRTGAAIRAPKPQRQPFNPAGREARQELERWVAAPADYRFAEVAGCYYGYRAAQFEEVKALAGTLAVLYSGVAMGALYDGKLKPDPALAFHTGLDRRALPVAELSHDEAVQYLRKGDLRAEAFAEGTNLVCAGGFALGFAKRIGNRVNNLYPNSLRILKGGA